MGMRHSACVCARVTSIALGRSVGRLTLTLSRPPLPKSPLLRSSREQDRRDSDPAAAAIVTPFDGAFPATTGAAGGGGGTRRLPLSPGSRHEATRRRLWSLQQRGGFATDGEGEEEEEEEDGDSLSLEGSGSVGLLEGSGGAGSSSFGDGGGFGSSFGSAASSEEEEEDEEELMRSGSYQDPFSRQRHQQQLYHRHHGNRTPSPPPPPLQTLQPLGVGVAVWGGRDPPSSPGGSMLGCSAVQQVGRCLCIGCWMLSGPRGGVL